MTPEVSIIVPVGPNARLQESMLSALCDLEYDGFEVIIVTAPGSKGVATSVCQDRLPVRMLPCRKDSPSALRNLGALAATKDLIAFLDPDCLPRPDWLSRLVHAKHSLKTRVVVGAAEPSNADESVWAGISGRRHRMWVETVRDGGFINRIDTRNLLIEKSLLVEAGMFDEALVSKEDRDLCFKIRRLREKIGFAKEAVVLHREPSTVPQLLRRAIWYGRGMAQFRKKYGLAPLSRSPDWIFYKSYVAQSPWLIASAVMLSTSALLYGLFGYPSLWLSAGALVALAKGLESVGRSGINWILGRNTVSEFVYDLVSDLGHKAGYLGSVF